MSLATRVVGLPTIRGNNEETYWVYNSQYRANGDGSAIPEGIFIELGFNSINEAKPSVDGNSVLGVSGCIKYSCDIDGIANHNNYCQPYTRNAMSIGVQFLDGEVDGVIGQNVYVATDGSGKATLVDTGIAPIGVLRSRVTTSNFEDSRCKQVNGAYIDFVGFRVLTPVVVP